MLGLFILYSRGFPELIIGNEFFPYFCKFRLQPAYFRQPFINFTVNIRQPFIQQAVPEVYVLGLQLGYLF